MKTTDIAQFEPVFRIIFLYVLLKLLGDIFCLLLLWLLNSMKWKDNQSKAEVKEAPEFRITIADIEEANAKMMANEQPYGHHPEDGLNGKITIRYKLGGTSHSCIISV